MTFDRLDHEIEKYFDDSHRRAVPATHTYICDVAADIAWDRQEMVLIGWFEERATQMLGEEGADYMDCRGLVAHWLEQQYVEVIDDAWYFTRAQEAVQWLPKA